MLLLQLYFNRSIYIEVPPSDKTTRIEVRNVGNVAQPSKSCRLGFKAPREVEIVREDAGNKQPKER